MFDAVCSDIVQTIAAKQIAAEMVDDSQGITVAPVAHEKLPLEVDGPNLIGSGGVEGSDTGMFPSPEAAPRTDTAVALENVEDGASSWQGLIGELFLESLQNLSGAPSISTVLLENPLDELVGGSMGTRAWCSAVIGDVSPRGEHAVVLS